MKEEVHPEELLLSYFEGTLPDTERVKVEEWKVSSLENQQVFEDSFKAWQGIEHLRRMKKYDAEEALHKFHSHIKGKEKLTLIRLFQKVAAIVLLPLLATTIYFALQTPAPEIKQVATVWQTIKTPAGTRSEFILPDSTKVYLNSETSLTYPVTFSASKREVELIGEAYFEVKKDKAHPFVVKTGKIDIEVTGTEFKASNYPQEQLTEIVLANGSIDLLQADNLAGSQVLTSLKPGEKACYDVKTNKMSIEEVDVEKYISWKDGVLMFRDDPMEDVVRRLNRWFNVDIKLIGNDFSDYEYTATFEDESIMQILGLLKISAPIDYKVIKRKQLIDNTFSKMEIEIIQR